MKLHANSLAWMLMEQAWAILLQAGSVYTGMTFTVSACRSEHYPIRQWHMVRNKAFVLWDLKIRIVFPLNQWGVCFTAMNNASLFQICFPNSHPFPLSPISLCLRCPPTYSVSSVFIPLHFIIKSRSWSLSTNATSFSLDDAPKLTDEDGRGAQHRCQPDLLSCNDMPFEIIHGLGTNAIQLFIFFYAL